MKKKIVTLFFATVIGTSMLTGCTNGKLESFAGHGVDMVLGEEDDKTGVADEESVSTQDMPTEIGNEPTETETSEADFVETESANETMQTEEQTQTQTESETESEPEGELSDIEKLTDGELEARRTQQAKFEEARATLYGLPNTKDKTIKINQMDRQILANNSYDFSKKNIVYIGDSITEGIKGSVTSDGRYISYPDYVQSYLHFNRYLNHGKGGRMFSGYGGEDYSIAGSFGDVTNIDSDIIVVFAGVNDYLSNPDNKVFGDINNKQSTSGYCGAVRSFMNQLEQYYGDRDIFFVTMYNVDDVVTSNYSDITTQPTLYDYIEVQRKLCAEYGFNVIELYDIGFMDCTDKQTASYYLNDSVHPNDNGNIALGEHIGAELSLYFSQN
jgi:lysophospholipase L1-like esterase